MEWHRRKLGKALSYLVLLAIAVPTLWVGGREYIKLFNIFDTPGKEQDEEGPIKEILSRRPGFGPSWAGIGQTGGGVIWSARARRVCNTLPPN